MSQKPELWGIDPEARYLWTPRAGREVTETPVIIDGVQQKDSAGDPLTKREYGPAQDGAPVFILAPLSERLALSISAAQSRYYTALERAKRSVLRGGSAADAMDAFVEKVGDIYPIELQSSVLKACVVGWRGLRSARGEIAFKGDWERDAKALRPDWMAELFNDIVNDSAWSTEDQESFLSQPESTPA